MATFVGSTLVDSSSFSDSALNSGPQYIENPLGFNKNPTIDRKISDGFVVDKPNSDPNPDVNSDGTVSTSSENPITRSDSDLSAQQQALENFYLALQGKEWFSAFEKLYPNYKSLDFASLLKLIMYKDKPDSWIQDEFDNASRFGGSSDAPWKKFASLMAEIMNIRKIASQQPLSNSDPLPNPDGSASNLSNLDDIASWLESFLYGNLYSQSNLISGIDYSQILISVRDALRAYLANSGLGDAASHELIEHVADISNSYLSALFSQALSYQTWYLQQEYNSPLNQVNRLAQAGLSSSFIFGNYSNTASSPANSSSVQGVNPSNAGAIQAQEDATSNSLFGSIFGAAVQGLGSLVGAGAGAILSLAQAATIKKMRPLEIAKAGSEIVNSAAAYELQVQSAKEISQNMQINQIKTEFDIAQQGQTALQQKVDVAKNAYDTSLILGTSEIQEQKWETIVTDKDGNQKKVRYTSDEVNEVIRRNGKDIHGNTVVGSEFWENLTSADVELSAQLGLPQIGVGMGTSGKLSHSDTKGSSSSVTSSDSSEIGYEKGSDRKKLTHDYSEDGSSFHIGKSTFTSVIDRRRVPLPEHEQYIKRTFDNYQKALDEYNTYSTGAKARLLRLLHNLNDNCTSYTIAHLQSLYRKRLFDIFKELKSDPFVGD